MKKIKVASLAGLAFAMIGTTLLVLRESLFAVGLFAISIQIFAGLIMFWARITFGKRSFHASADPTSGGLVTTGPYKFIRHPIYASILYFIWAGILEHTSVTNVLLGLSVTFALLVRIFSEEYLIKQRYPNYLNYAAKTKRIIPYIF